MSAVFSLLGYMFGAIQTGSWGGLFTVVVLATINIIIAIGFTFPSIHGQQNGIVTLTADQMINGQMTANLLQQYKISSSSLTDTGVYEVLTMNGSEMSRSYYGLLTVGDRVLLASINDPINPTILSYMGAFTPLDDDWDELQDKIAAKYPDIMPRLLPILFSEQAENSGNSSFYTILSFQIILLLITMYALWRFLVMTVFPEK
jgi:hypothetical protein